MLQIEQLRRDDRSDRALVDRTICMPTGLVINRAHVQASATADAIEGFARFLTREYICPPVIEKNDVEFLRPVAWCYARPDRIVGVHPLSGGGARKYLQKYFEISEVGHNLLDADKRDENVRQSQAHSPVTFAFHDDQRSGVGDRKICTANSELYVQKLVAEIEARGFSELRRIFSEVVDAKRFQRHSSFEDLAHLHAIDVQRGNHNVRGLVVAQLNNEVGQISFMRSNALMFQVLI